MTHINICHSNYTYKHTLYNMSVDIHVDLYIEIIIVIMIICHQVHDTIYLLYGNIFYYLYTKYERTYKHLNTIEKL